MLTAQALAMGGVSIPPVNKEDLKRVWLKLEALNEEHGGMTSGIAYDQRVFAGSIRSDDADPMAVFARVTILSVLKLSNSLNRWTANGEVLDVVYARAADFPLPNGMQSFQLDQFMSAMQLSDTPPL